MYSKGDIVVINFPFSDLVNSKKRPMVVLAVKGQDIIGCAITSNPDSDGLPLEEFAEGSLPLRSKIKYGQIHTFIKSLVIKKIARISKKDHHKLIMMINELLRP